MLEATRRMCGIAEVQWAEVAHPLGSLLADELRQRAELAVTQFESIVLRQDARRAERATAT